MQKKLKSKKKKKKEEEKGQFKALSVSQACPWESW